MEKVTTAAQSHRSYQLTLVRYWLRMLVQKSSDHEYELRGEGGLFLNAILKTKKAIYDSTGTPVGIKIKHLGKKSYSLQNGFSADFQIWEECDYDVKIDCVEYRGTDSSLTWPRRPKNINCLNSVSRNSKPIKKETKAVQDNNSCNEDCYQRLSSKKSEALACYDECNKKYEK